MRLNTDLLIYPGLDIEKIEAMACDSISSSSDVSDRLLVPPDSPGSSVSTTLQVYNKYIHACS